MHAILLEFETLMTTKILKTGDEIIARITKDISEFDYEALTEVIEHLYPVEVIDWNLNDQLLIVSKDGRDLEDVFDKEFVQIKERK